MGSISSKIENDTKLREDAPEYAKKFSNELKYLLLRLQEEYTEQFCYGLHGLNNRYVEVIAPNDLLKEFKEIFPYKCEEDTAKIEKQKKRMYKDITYLNKYTWELNRTKSLKFFSTFSLIRPQCDRVWIHIKGEEGIFKELTFEEVKDCFYLKDVEKCKENFVNIDKKFSKGRLTITRRIGVLFGNHNIKKPLSMKLVFYENARPQTNSGMFRLYFSYYTYDDSVLVHEPIHFYKNMKSKKKRKIDVENKTNQFVADDYNEKDWNEGLRLYKELEREREADLLPNGEVKPEILEQIRKQIFG